MQPVYPANANRIPAENRIWNMELGGKNAEELTEEIVYILYGHFVCGDYYVSDYA